MNLPNASVGIVDRGKITEYLLNRSHPDNGGKAAFFSALGFRANDWAALATAWCMLAISFPVSRTVESAHGTKYVVDGEMETRAGERPVVRTIWVVDWGEKDPRLVTAYPHEE